MRCFVVMPIGTKGSEKYRQFLAIYNYIIKEAVEPLDYTCERADEIPRSGIIPEQISQALREAELVIADLTEKNPNVMYEVGVRQALGKPIISIAQDIQGLPFDISHYRTIEYHPSDIESIAECRKLLAEYVRKLVVTAAPSASEEPLEGLERRFEIGLENVYRILGELVPRFEQTTNKVDKLFDKWKAMIGDEPNFRVLSERIQELISANQILMQMSQLGLVNIFKNRMDAIEQYFFNIMRDEPSELDIVGSTIFGLKGYRNASFEQIIELLRSKHSNPDFKLRILLTHWDFISYRQDQEKTEKNIARYVISKELNDAIDFLKSKGMADTVKFYKGSPTCFTIIAEGQKQMLINPYPYQREAYNSWCIVVRETFGGVYSDFKKAHFDEPWANSQLAVPYDEQCQYDLAQKLAADISLAREQMLEQLGPKKD